VVRVWLHSRIVAADVTSSGVRLAEIVAALSLATDLGLGQPQAHVLRQTAIAVGLADAAGLSEQDKAAAYYVSLLAWVGCVADSHEMARWFGDDIQLRADSYQVDKLPIPTLKFLLQHLAAGESSMHRISAVGRFLAAGAGAAGRSMVTHCQTTGDFAVRLGLGPEVRRPLQHAFERWDGKGVPGSRSGEEIDLVMRLVHIADDVEVHHRLGGIDAAVSMLRSRRGTEFDPALVDCFCANADGLLAALDDDDAWDRVITNAPSLGRELTEPELTAALEGFADYADVRSPWRLGHSRGVASLAVTAAERIGLPAGDRVILERAGLVHDLGSIGVPATVWDKPGAWNPAEWERVRTHPYLTERIMARPPRLAEVGALARLHHERLDGSGYPHGLHAEALPMTARILAAADVYHAMVESRPHRGPLTPAQRAEALHSEATAGRLDGEAVGAVLAAAGHRIRRRPAPPAGLTPREVEVLVLLSRGRTNKAIAAELSISPKTVGSHVEHIYRKLGVSTRGAVSMIAMRHGLLASDILG
jgi:HD-GYP domain-containing protein (c-di-GMP phosphodiesterase class II)